MKLTRIASINNYRIFKSFAWPTGLPSFARFNVIYGWNGSGKTALSSLFAHLQTKQSPRVGSFSFRFDDGTTVDATDLFTKEYPPIRVFNRDFIENIIISIRDEDIAPIFYLGEEAAVGKKEIDKLNEELRTIQVNKKEAMANADNARKALDAFCIAKAKLIKEALLGSPDYANYNKAQFKTAIDDIKADEAGTYLLSDEEKNKLHIQKNLKPKQDIAAILIDIPDVTVLRTKVEELCRRTIASQILGTLIKKPEVNKWVQQGLSLHSGVNESSTCWFCGNLFSSARRTELEAHFNDAYMGFQRELEQAILYLQKAMIPLQSLALPDESRFYDHLSTEANQIIEIAKAALNALQEVLQEFIAQLELKKNSPFLPQTASVISIVDSEENIIATESLWQSINKINTLVNKHNDISKNIQTEILAACKALERNYALESLPEYESLSSAVELKSLDVENIKTKPRDIELKIADIERTIKEHRRPADELNAELSAYLGRGDLRFELKDAGYSLKRNGEPASHLSEGERTAIALLYFLKVLEDKDFDKSDGIVVIDDPVSSLDSNSLFSAFAYIKERTKDCNQLFILTHNFTFFRQVKNWIHHLRNQNKKDISIRPGHFYSLSATTIDEERNAVLSVIDPLLEEFESEYHFLFKTLYSIAITPENEKILAQYYSIPNIARRVLEMFLAYHLPTPQDLFAKFEDINFDPAKKTQILRLLNTYSHGGGIAAPEHDPTILVETRATLQNFFEMIAHCNHGHYETMCDRIMR